MCPGHGPKFLCAGPRFLCARLSLLEVYLRATLNSRCGASPPRVGQYSHLPSLVTHVEAPLGTLSRNFVTSPVGDTLNIVIPLDVKSPPSGAIEKSSVRTPCANNMGPPF